MSSASNCQECVCSNCDRDFTVSMSSSVELDNYDELLTLLLSVKGFLSCILFL